MCTQIHNVQNCTFPIIQLIYKFHCAPSKCNFLHPFSFSSYLGYSFILLLFLFPLISVSLSFYLCFSFPLSLFLLSLFLFPLISVSLSSYLSFSFLLSLFLCFFVSLFSYLCLSFLLSLFLFPLFLSLILFYSLFWPMILLPEDDPAKAIFCNPFLCNHNNLTAHIHL